MYPRIFFICIDSSVDEGVITFIRYLSILNCKPAIEMFLRDSHF